MQKKALEEYIHTLCSEPAIINVDEADLIKMFPTPKNTMYYFGTIDKKLLRKEIALCVRWYKAHTKRIPVSTCLQVLSSSDITINSLEVCKSILEGVDGKVNCVYTYGKRQDIPKGMVRFNLLVM